MTDIRVVRGIGEVDPRGWNETVGGSVFHRYEWLAALEGSGLVRVSPRHVVVERDGRMVAAAPLYLTEFCPKLEMFRSYYLRSPVHSARTLVGHSMYAQSSAVFAPDPDSRRALIDEAEQIWRTEAGDGLLLFPLVPAGSPALAELAGRGYGIGLLSCTNLLDIGWGTFEEYLASRPSAKRRNILASLRHSEGKGVTAEVTRGSEVDTALLASLVRRVAERHQSPLFFTESFISSVLAEMGDSAAAVTIRAAGRPLLCCLFIEGAGEVVPWCIGMDYDSLDEFGQYNYLYVTLIRYAIEQRRRVINFGRSTYYIKRKYGCQQHPVYLAAKASAELAPAVAEWVGAIDQRAREELVPFGIAQPPGIGVEVAVR